MKKIFSVPPPPFSYLMLCILITFAVWYVVLVHVVMMSIQKNTQKVKENAFLIKQSKTGCEFSRKSSFSKLRTVRCNLSVRDNEVILNLDLLLFGSDHNSSSVGSIVSIIV